MNDSTRPGATIDPDTHAVRRTILIAARPELVWRTITEPELVRLWFGELRLQPAHVGSSGTINWPGEPAVAITIEAIDPIRSITYRWRNEPGEPAAALTTENSTVFTFTVDEHGDGVELTVVETGFEHTADPTGQLEGHRDGWNEKLDQLADLEMFRR